MFSHVMLGCSDRERSKKFYDATLGALGHKPGQDFGKSDCSACDEVAASRLAPPMAASPCGHLLTIDETVP